MPKKVPRPMAPSQFRFESAWLLDKTYKDMMAASWNQNQSVSNNLVHVQQELKRWRFQTCDQILRTKKHLMARIAGIQRSLQHGNTRRGIWQLESKLQGELREILKQEELMWFQRSRAKWLKDGARNT
ncbi:hypothetical protein A2U01_0007334 [Trifolium medium]|uniref:Uncharacterized protein n=1 Tax=Trifolium medium TaxID=97028 RepID=A0A392MG65_9FABA|nr:hypothetical protein [Trifolium medium]